MKSSAIILPFLVALVSAQNTLPGLNQLSSLAPGGQTSAASSAATTAASNTAASSGARTTAQSSGATTNAPSSGTAASTTGGSTTGGSSATSAATTTEAISSLTGAPSLSTGQTTGTSVSQAYTFSNAPTLAGVGIPTMIVPDTARAAFMQKSSLPEGTVFICVGAILGAFGVALIAWRAMVAWALRRSVKRAAEAKYAADTKRANMFDPTFSDMYDPGTNLSMEHLTSDTGYKGAGAMAFASELKSKPRHSRASSRDFSKTGNPRAPNASTLFFSPTAGAGAANDTGVSGGGIASHPHSAAASARTSRYLPAGYYAAGSSGAGSGYGRLEDTPPASPGLRPTQGASPSGGHRASSSFNGLGAPMESGRRPSGVAGDSAQRRSRLNPDAPARSQQASGRAPSAFLEDLFENHGSGPRERF